MHEAGNELEPQLHKSTEDIISHILFGAVSVVSGALFAILANYFRCFLSKIRSDFSSINNQFKGITDGIERRLSELEKSMKKDIDLLFVKKNENRERIVSLEAQLAEVKRMCDKQHKE